MRFCQDCGTGHECTAETGGQKAQVEIVRLETQRDIEVARISANAAKNIAETEAEHSSEHAEGVAEGMETALDAVTGEDGGAEPEGEPIVVETGPAEEPEPLEPDNAPPVVEVPETRARRGSGWWDGYR